VFPLTWIWSSIVHHLSGPKRYALRLRIKTPACSASLTRFLLKKVTFIVHLNVGSDTSIQFGLLGPCFKTGAARLSVCVFCCWERDSITYSANQLGSEASRPKSIVLVSPNLGQQQTNSPPPRLNCLTKKSFYYLPQGLSSERVLTSFSLWNSKIFEWYKKHTICNHCTSSSPETRDKYNGLP